MNMFNSLNCSKKYISSEKLKNIEQLAFIKSMQLNKKGQYLENINYLDDEDFER